MAPIVPKLAGISRNGIDGPVSIEGRGELAWQHGYGCDEALRDGNRGGI
ncbi:hypothetical protein SH528x_004939 [Novipirellula sp. SH528]